MIFVIDDDEIMAECVARACGEDEKVRIFTNAIEAMQAMDVYLPDLIFLDILLDGPDGFTLLNEMQSYIDMAKVPVVIVTSLSFEGEELAEYGVVGVLNKDTMKPEEIKRYVEQYSE